MRILRQSLFCLALFFFISLLWGNACSADDELITVQAQVKNAHITVDDILQYTLLLRHDPRVTIQSPLDIDVPSDVFRIAGRKTQPIYSDVAGYTNQKLLITLIPLKLGKFILISKGVDYTDAQGNPDTIRSNQLYIEVSSSPAAREKSTYATIHDIKDLFPIETSRMSFGWAIGVFTFLLLLCLVYLTKKWMRTTAHKRKIRILTPEEEVVSRLDTLEKLISHMEGSMHKHYAELADIVRTFLERYFCINIKENTTAELIRYLNETNIISTEARKDVAAILRVCDLVKFAKCVQSRETLVADVKKMRSIIEGIIYDVQDTKA